MSDVLKHLAHCSSAAIYNCTMYIIAIGWLYVTTLMALTETSVIAGIMSFTFYGLAPTALLLWLFGRPGRRRNSNATPEEKSPHAPEQPQDVNK